MCRYYLVLIESSFFSFTDDADSSPASVASARNGRYYGGGSRERGLMLDELTRSDSHRAAVSLEVCTFDSLFFI